IRFPIEIKNLVFRSQKIFRMPMAFETPCHAVRLCLIDHRHVIDRTVATETTDAPVHMRCVIVINIIDRAMDPHPLDWVARFPAHPHRLQLWIVLLHLGMAVHAGLCIGHIRVRRHLHKTMAIPAIHSQLRDVNVVRKRHRLYRLITDFGIFWRHVIPRPCGKSTNDHDAANHEFRRQPKYTKVGYQPIQPVPFPHDIHVTQLGMDCRYCHSFVEVAAHSNVPNTQTCMNCHTQVQKDNPKLEPVRASWKSGDPVDWVWIYRTVDYVYYNHAAHVNRGISCFSCHGPVNHMSTLYLAKPHSMAWCLDCH